MSRPLLIWQECPAQASLIRRQLAELPYPMDGARFICIRHTQGEWQATLYETGHSITRHPDENAVRRASLLWVADRVMHDAQNEEHPVACHIWNEIADELLNDLYPKSHATA